MFLNMLVGIMTDTYNRNSSLRAQKALQQKSFFYSDWSNFIRKQTNKFELRYLYVIEPVPQESNSDNTLEIFKEFVQNSENVVKAE